MSKTNLKLNEKFQDNKLLYICDLQKRRFQNKIYYGPQLQTIDYI